MFPTQGISAHEVIDFFFDKETRLEWEGTLESVDVVETLAEDSIIFHQLHKRVWPSTQREDALLLPPLSADQRPSSWEHGWTHMDGL